MTLEQQQQIKEVILQLHNRTIFEIAQFIEEASPKASRLDLAESIRKLRFNTLEEVDQAAQAFTR
jgi:hypothetical protein